MKEHEAADRVVVAINALLDNVMVGVVYLDRRGRIVEANARARAILRCGDGLADRAGYLHARMEADDARLGNLLRRVCGSASPAVAGSIAVERLPKLPRLAVHLSPMSVDGDGIGIGRAAALALIVDPAGKPRLDADHVAATLGLTRAESSVAVALAQGASVRDIATGTGRKESSVRWLIKNIHNKLDVSRNADMVRMVLTAAWGAGPSP